MGATVSEFSGPSRPSPSQTAPDQTSSDGNGKAEFGHLYNQSDPRDYFHTLGALDYRAPAHGEEIFAHLVDRRRQQLGRPDISVLDVCCSYGINAALLNHDLTLDALYDHYRSPDLAALSTDELVAADRAFYGEHRRPRPVDVLGLDVADQAVAYAQRVGLLRASSSENLETGDPSADLAQRLATVDLITVTGGIGYITERTFDRLLHHASTNGGCWVASFVLRWVPFQPVAEVLARYGFVTEQMSDRTFHQRRFADDAERDFVLGELEKQGIDPVGKEADGWHHSSFYLSCPPGTVKPCVADVLSGSSDQP